MGSLGEGRLSTSICLALRLWRWRQAENHGGYFHAVTYTVPCGGSSARSSHGASLCLSSLRSCVCCHNVRCMHCAAVPLPVPAGAASVCVTPDTTATSSAPADCKQSKRCHHHGTSQGLRMHLTPSASAHGTHAPPQTRSSSRHRSDRIPFTWASNSPASACSCAVFPSSAAVLLPHIIALCSVAAAAAG